MTELKELSRKRKLAHKKLLDIGGGRATVSARFALEIMDQVFGPA